MPEEGRENNHLLRHLLLATLALLTVEGLPVQKTGQDEAGISRRSANDMAEIPGTEVPNCAGWNTVQFFESASAEAVVECIAAGADPNMEGEWGETPLHLTAVTENAAVAKTLIAAGADLNAKAESFGETPLHFALVQKFYRAVNNDAVIQTLITAGANPSTQDDWGETPLHWAVLDDQPLIAQALIARGADPNTQNRDGYTPLHYAANRNPNLAMTQTLIAAGADPNAKGDEGEVPLHGAAGNDNAAVIDTLLSAGAKLNAVSARGETVLHAALYAANARILLAKGADVHARDENGQTPLHSAAAYGEEAELIDVLVAAGAEINDRDSSGRTPLHCFASGFHRVSSDPPTAELLLAHGADIDVQDEDGSTSLHLAAASSSSTAGDIVIALLDAGADPLLPNVDGEIPWDVAKINQNNESLKNSQALHRLNPAGFDSPTE